MKIFLNFLFAVDFQESHKNDILIKNFKLRMTCHTRK